jgi:dihydroorotate dehydrogenase (NAD+) catalytic subunit
LISGIPDFLGEYNILNCGLGISDCGLKLAVGHCFCYDPLDERPRVALGFNRQSEIHNPKMVDLSTEVAGIRLKNPVVAASGTFGYGEEFSQLIDLSQMGGFIVKGLSIEPMKGAAAPRLHETASGMLNAIGLQNVGVKRFVEEKLPRLRQLNTLIFANVFGYSTEDYVRVVEVLNSAEGLAGYEINISCPNVKRGGIVYGTDPAATYEVVKAIKSMASLPVIVKLSPNVTDITVIARAAQDAGADALSLINTLLGMSIDVETRQPRLGNLTGGLSGPAIKPVAVRMVFETVRAVRIPVIGIGGIRTAEDALEYLLVGAKAIEVGTANFLDPEAPIKIIRGLAEFCKRKGIERLSSIVGTVRNETENAGSIDGPEKTDHCRSGY